MSNYLKIGGLLLVGTLVGLLIRSGAPSTIEVNVPEPDLSGVYSLSNKNFAQGIKVGTNDQFQVSSTGAVTSSGASLSVGSSSPSTMGEVVVDGSGTTSVAITSSTASKGGCIQIENTDGTASRVYVRGTTVVAEAGKCK